MTHDVDQLIWEQPVAALEGLPVYKVEISRRAHFVKDEEPFTFTVARVDPPYREGEVKYVHSGKAFTERAAVRKAKRIIRELKKTERYKRRVLYL